jgi:hypothetical protein
MHIRSRPRSPSPSRDLCNTELSSPVPLCHCERGTARGDVLREISRIPAVMGKTGGYALPDNGPIMREVGGIEFSVIISPGEVDRGSDEVGGSARY